MSNLTRQEILYAMNRVIADLDKRFFTAIRRPHPDPDWYIVDIIYQGVEIGYLELPADYSPLWTSHVGLGITDDVSDESLRDTYGGIFQQHIVQPLLRHERQMELDKEADKEWEQNQAAAEQINPSSVRPNKTTSEINGKDSIRKPGWYHDIVYIPLPYRFTSIIQEEHLFIDYPAKREIPYSFEITDDEIRRIIFRTSLSVRPGWGVKFEATSPTSARYVFTAEGIESPIGYILVYGSAYKTTIEIRCEMLELFSSDSPLPLGPEPTRQAIEIMIGTLEWFAEHAVHAIQETVPPSERISADEIIRRFYRRRKNNPNLQLKDICAEFDISYAYVRKRKVTFDKRKRKQ